jgi:putative transcriptional regulator
MPVMPAPSYLSRHLLIAMPSLEDPNFARGVTLICQHGEDGAMGLVINRPSDWRLGDLMAQIGVEHVPANVARQPVLAGGPVQGERGFVLHEPAQPFESSARISEGLVVTTSKDVLHAIAEGRGPQRYLVLLGYAGWSSGQLEQEMRENAWLTAEPRDNAILFDTPIEQRWDASARLLGVDINLLAGAAGHA